MERISSNTTTTKKRSLLSQSPEQEKEFRNCLQRMRISEKENHGPYRNDNTDSLTTPELKELISESVKEGIRAGVYELRKDLKNTGTFKSSPEYDAIRKKKVTDAVKFAEKNNNIRAAQEFNVSEATIRRWRYTNRIEEYQKNPDTGTIKEKTLPVRKKKTTPFADMEVTKYRIYIYIGGGKKVIENQFFRIYMFFKFEFKYYIII